MRTFCVFAKSIICFTCCLNSRLHLRPGEARERAKLMQRLVPFQNGSRAGMRMGKHFSESKDAEKLMKN